MEQFVCLAAIEGLEARKAEIQRQLDDANKRYQDEVLGKTLSKRQVSTWMEKVAKSAPKRNISAAGRKRIADAQKKRWAAFRKAQKKGGKK